MCGMNINSPSRYPSMDDTTRISNDDGSPSRRSSGTLTVLIVYNYTPVLYFFKHNFCVKRYLPREPRRNPSNRRLNEHGIYIRHCHVSNSQPVPSQAGADTTRPQKRDSQRF